jgi:hypothetical protein
MVAAWASGLVAGLVVEEIVFRLFDTRTVSLYYQRDPVVGLFCALAPFVFLGCLFLLRVEFVCSTRFSL